MSNRIVSYSRLSEELKMAFRIWLNQKKPELISFPFKGMHVKGYAFDYQMCKYMVIMYLKNEPNNMNALHVNETF
jgi:hypothetical protein